MPVLKPIRGIRLNKSHPLARGLVGYWLLNEGSGNKVFDLSGNGKTTTLYNSPIWTPGRFGSALEWNTNNQYGVLNDFSLDNFTIVVWFYNHEDSAEATQAPVFASDNYDASPRYVVQIKTAHASNKHFECKVNDIGTAVAYAFTKNMWHQAALVRDGTAVYCYAEGLYLNLTITVGSGTFTFYNPRIGCQYYQGSNQRFYDGLIDHVLIYNRALPASEIASLYREPFCMFDRAWRPGLIGGQIVELAGTSTALSSVEGSLSVSGLIVELAGTIAGRSNVNGHLSLLDWTEGSWLREALFNGMTANAFKLGTSLSLGWFWVRVTGCSVLYRGESSLLGVDFTNILVVFNLDTSDGSRAMISPPSYIPHDGGGDGSTYFYVARRFNNCGYQERTLAAAVKVSIKPNGELAEPQPNNIAGSKAEQVDSNKVRLTWFYWPCEQGSKPVKFNVYYDDRTGQIDYQNPLFSIEYKGRRFYSFQSSTLEAGEYLFAIRAEDAGGIENISLARLKIQLDTLNPDAIDILRTEAV
ncbi:MAG: LamG domain-containing protein [Planctomycetes bacterium]|nr:LamG domain-containing protein [Planctomycetota bacterium]